jgi:hypothetical protein
MFYGNSRCAMEGLASTLCVVQRAAYPELRKSAYMQASQLIT